MITDEELLHKLLKNEPEIGRKIYGNSPPEDNIYMLPDPFLKIWRTNQFYIKSLIIHFLMFAGISLAFINGSQYQNLVSMGLLAVVVLFALAALNWVDKREKELGYWKCIGFEISKKKFEFNWQHIPGKGQQRLGREAL